MTGEVAEGGKIIIVAVGRAVTGVKELPFRSCTLIAVLGPRSIASLTLWPEAFLTIPGIWILEVEGVEES